MFMMCNMFVCLCFTAVPSAAGTDHEVSAAEPAAAERARGHRMEWKPGRSSVSGQSCWKEHGTSGAGGRETSQTAAAESSAAARVKNTLGCELFNMHLNGCQIIWSHGFKEVFFVWFAVVLVHYNIVSFSMEVWQWASGVMGHLGCGQELAWKGRSEVATLLWVCGMRPWRTRQAIATLAWRTATAVPLSGTHIYTLFLTGSL